MVRDVLTVQLIGVMAKSRLGEPLVSAASDVRTPLLWAVSETVTGRELAPTAVIPENVSGVVEIWAPACAARASTPAASIDHRFPASNRFESMVRRGHFFQETK